VDNTRAKNAKNGGSADAAHRPNAIQKQKPATVELWCSTQIGRRGKLGSSDSAHFGPALQKGCIGLVRRNYPKTMQIGSDEERVLIEAGIQLSRLEGMRKKYTRTHVCGMFAFADSPKLNGMSA
jgi:hypothetical protein